MSPINNHLRHSSLTSAGVDLQLAVDVALVHQRVQNVEDAVDVPDLGVVPQEFDFLLGLLGRLAAVLTEGLELQMKGWLRGFVKAIHLERDC